MATFEKMEDAYRFSPSASGLMYSDTLNFAHDEQMRIRSWHAVMVLEQEINSSYLRLDIGS